MGYTFRRYSTCILVADHLIPDADTSKSKFVTIYDYLGREDKFPMVKTYIRCPYFEGWAEVGLAPIKFCGVLLGNYPGVRKLSPSSPNDPEKTSYESCEHTHSSVDQISQAVETRSSKNKRIHPLVLPIIEPLNITPEKFSELQSTCSSLSSVRCKVESGVEDLTRDGNIFKFESVDGLIYRTCIKSTFLERIGKRSLIVPAECRSIILSLAHEGPLAGHFSHRKTEMRVKEHFHWPGMGSDICDFC